MKSTFFKKFLLVNTIVVISCFVITIVLLSFFVGNYITDEKKEMLKENCNTIVSLVSQKNELENYDEESIALFRTISEVAESDIYISNLDGEVLLCGCSEWSIDGDCEHNQKIIPKSIIQTIKSGDYNESGDLDGFFSNVKFTSASMLYNKNHDAIGVVFATISPTNIQNFFNSIFRLFLFSALLPIIFMFFAEFYISYKFTKPLRLMAEASRSMAKGDFSKRIPVTGNNEISELAVAFNQMTNSLVQLESTRRHFIANISHEFKTPMTNIGGFIDGIIDDTIPPEKHSYYLNIVSNEIKRLSRLVGSMLSLSKLESGVMQINQTNFDLLDLTLNIIISQEQRIEGKKLNISGLENIKPTMLNADYDLIYQVVYNLIDNAIKFTNESGTISFEINSFNNLIQFKIKNTGEGIDKKDIPFVFERFYKTDKSRSMIKDSTGLGLHLANAIISIHGGRISVKSELNQYTEFTFVLPCETPKENKRVKNKK